MAQRKIQFVSGEIYHIVMRAIDGLNLFKNKKDYLRMIHNLFEFNDTSPAPSYFRVATCRNKENVTRKGLVTLMERRKKRKMFVEIMAFSLMPNHVHLLVKQLREGGISKFLQKFGGYALYYNKKYERGGHLFQGKFRAVHIKNNEQLKTIFVYIHTNSAAIIYPKWKERGIKDVNRAIQYVENYRWSSYPDYLGKKNFPSLTKREFLLKVMGGMKACRNFVNGWLKYKNRLPNFEYVAID